MPYPQKGIIRDTFEREKQTVKNYSMADLHGEIDTVQQGGLKSYMGMKKSKSLGVGWRGCMGVTEIIS